MKIGDYVRTKYGIAKYIRNKVTKQTIYFVIDKSIVYDNVKGYENCLCGNEIIKSSSNIMDLIEVGDFINGEQIMDIRNDDNINNETLLYYYIPSDYGEDCFRNKDIKSIVTKEQFENMEYKVE